MKAIFKILLFGVLAIIFTQCKRFGEDEPDPEPICGICTLVTVLSDGTTYWECN